MEFAKETGSPAEDRDMAGHMASCSRCRLLTEEWMRLREAASGLAAPSLSPAVEDMVRRLCHSEIETLRTRAAAEASAPSLPRFFWPAFVALALLTVLALIPGLKDFLGDGNWTYRTTLAVILVVQNVLTLLFSPLLLVGKPGNGNLSHS